jgi:hypothetical protein
MCFRTKRVLVVAVLPSAALAALQRHRGGCRDRALPVTTAPAGSLAASDVIVSFACGRPCTVPRVLVGLFGRFGMACADVVSLAERSVVSTFHFFASSSNYEFVCL